MKWLFPLFLALSVSCATTNNPPPLSPLLPSKTLNKDSFFISLGETKTVFLRKQGSAYHIAKIRNGVHKETDVVIFEYYYNGPAVQLTVRSFVNVPFITYDCFFMNVNLAKQTTIMDVPQNVPVGEIWQVATRTLLIENIHEAK